jgi:hypothetical protein
VKKRTLDSAKLLFDGGLELRAVLELGSGRTEGGEVLPEEGVCSPAVGSRG